jgi:uncharacterized protein
LSGHVGFARKAQHVHASVNKASGSSIIRIKVKSASGVKYDHGLFHVPPIILHVTRGISGKLPMRLNCPPVIALLILLASREISA